MRMPNGYDSIVGERGATLSGGQRQRIGIARAVIRDAPILILDEPTAALDPRAERALYDSIRQLCVGRTVILISHRFSSVRNADRIVVLERGKKIEEGTHTALMDAGGVYAELFSMQAAAYLDTGATA
jgi:ABC-type multidrug transport system fused ATPase/permease subunit